MQSRTEGQKAGEYPGWDALYIKHRFRRFLAYTYFQKSSDAVKSANKSKIQ